MSERKLIREFLDLASNTCSGCGYSPCRCEALCDCCGCEICQCPENVEESSYDFHSLESGEAHHDIEFDHQGNISPEELHHHFDLNDDGVVTPQEYVNHIEYHAKHPEALDHYRGLRSQSHQTVPCTSSYDNCSQHLMSNPHDIDLCLKPLMDFTGSSCRESSTKALLDVLQSLIKCGVLG